jgi:hypothetical protein
MHFFLLSKTFVYPFSQMKLWFCFISTLSKTIPHSLELHPLKEHPLKPASSISAPSKTTPLNFPPHNAVDFQNFQKERTRLKGIYFKIKFCQAIDNIHFPTKLFKFCYFTKIPLVLA